MHESLVVPTLAAGPFRLRPFAMADLDLIREASQDPYIPLITTVPAAFTDEEGRRFIERQWDRARQGTGYSFAIAEVATDRPVGQIGLWKTNLRDGRCSIGYWVAASARGRHAARLALAALTRWAFAALPVPRLELYVEPWNRASIRTAEAAGFRKEGLLRSWQEIGGERKDMFMYSLLPAEARQGARPTRQK
jgi:[ribosomal protein S5]-alanine N-acetyltransferase